MKKDKDIIIVITDDSVENIESSSTPEIDDDFAIPVAEEITPEPFAKPDFDIEDDEFIAETSEISNEATNDKEETTTEKTTTQKKSKPSLVRDLSKRFVVLSIIISLAIITVAATTAYFIPKSEESKASGLERLKQKDADYLQAKSVYDSASEERDQLSGDLELKKQALDEFNGSKDSIDKIRSINEELESTRDQLRKEANEKQNELDNITTAIESNAAKTTTLSSGYYKVGEDITEGTYTVTGTGSIAIANSGKSIANKPLKKEGESFTLNKNDRVQIDGTAKFIPQ